MYFWAEKMVSENKTAAKHGKAGSSSSAAKRHSLKAEQAEAAALARERAKAKALAGSATGGLILVNLSRAFLARALFIVHAIVTIWAAVHVQQQPSLWVFALVAVSIVVEGAYTILMRMGDERRWFSPAMLLYILATAPPIWLLETKLCQWRLQSESTHSYMFEYQILEQLLLVVLIVGRWLLPKGNISREQLSQILLAYLAISSDIVEFFDVFKERTVYASLQLQHVVLSAWTFPFILTVSRARKMRVAITEDEEPIVNKGQGWTKVVYDIDIWAIMVASLLQDIPFFLVRLYLIVYHHLVTYTTIFFLSKNALVIMLQFYRAIVLFNDRYLNPRRDSTASVLIEGAAMRRNTLVEVGKPDKDNVSLGSVDPKRGRPKARKSLPADPDLPAPSQPSRRASTAPHVRTVKVQKQDDSGSMSPSKRPKSAFDKYID